MTNTHDALIIGAGQAGPALAGRLTAAGMSVGLIERKLFGGTCVNTGCIPTKTLIASAYAAHLARRAAEYGVSAGGEVSRGHEGREGAQRHDLEAIPRGCRILAREHGALHGLPRPRAVCLAARGASGRRPHRGETNLHQCGRPRSRPGHAGNRSRRHFDQHVDSRARRAAATFGRGRRQLCRPRVRADVPPLRRRGDRRGEVAAADRARGRGRIGRDQSRFSKPRASPCA